MATINAIKPGKEFMPAYMEMAKSAYKAEIARKNGESSFLDFRGEADGMAKTLTALTGKAPIMCVDAVVTHSVIIFHGDYSTEIPIA